MTDGRPKAIAVLLLDSSNDKLYQRAREEFDSFAGPEDARILRLMLTQIAEDAKTRSGNEILNELESTLSNSVRITERGMIALKNVDSILDELYAKHVWST